jgi:FtsZ-binding cell division protein ZapB
MRDSLAAQTEATLQARIKELEEDNRALSVTNAIVVASEKAIQAENSKLQKDNNLLEWHVDILHQHYEPMVE